MQQSNMIKLQSQTIMFFLRRALKGKTFTTVGSSLRPKRGLKKKVGARGERRQERQENECGDCTWSSSCTFNAHGHTQFTIVRWACTHSAWRKHVTERHQITSVAFFLEWKQWLERVLWQWLQRLDCADRGLHWKTRYRYSQTLTNLQNVYSGRYP